jgi:hypothetical protein
LVSFRFGIFGLEWNFEEVFGFMLSEKTVFREKMEAIPEVPWGPILAAAGGDDAARQLLLGLGSSSRRHRGLVRRLLPFSLTVFDEDVSHCRALFPKIARLTVKGDVEFSVLDNIPTLHLLGGIWPAPYTRLASVTSLTLTDWWSDLQFLREMPGLQTLQILGLTTTASTAPIASLERLRYLRCEGMMAEGVLAPRLGDSGLPFECILEVDNLLPLSQTRDCTFCGPWAMILRDLASGMADNDFEDTHWGGYYSG